MRVLILGSTGQMARALLETCPDAKSSQSVPFTVQALGRPDIDFCRPETVERALVDAKPDIVVNAAAYTAVDQAESEPETAFAINRDGAAGAAKAAGQIGARFLHLSTDFVFDGTKETPYAETDVPNPQSIYAQSKFAGEEAVVTANPEAVIVRLSWVYSPWGSNFAKTMLRLAATREEIGVVADQHGRPSSAIELARALWGMMQSSIDKPMPHLLYHLGPQGTASWADFAGRVMDASKALGGPAAAIKRIRTTDYPTPAQRPARAVLDCSRFQTDWGITLPDWQESCDPVVARILASTEEDNRA